MFANNTTTTITNGNNSNSEEYVSNSRVLQQPYLQRSTSAPPVAANVSETLLPTGHYNFDGVIDGADSLYYRNNAPTRANPRMPKTSLTEVSNHHDLPSFDDNSAILASIIGNSDQARANGLSRAAGDTPTHHDSNLLATLSVDKTKPYGAQDDFAYSTQSSVFSRLKLGAGANDKSLDNAMQSMYITNPQQQVRPQQMRQQIPASYGNGIDQNGYQQTSNRYNASGIPVSTQPQQSYYQQPVYVDQNGQPVYYRVANQQGSYIQDNVYAADGVDSYSQYNMQNQQGYYMQGNQGNYSNTRRGGSDYSNLGSNHDNDDYMHGRDDMRSNRNDNRNDRGGKYNNNGGSRNNSNNNMSNMNATNSINPMRDSVVEEFRNTYGKSRQWGLSDLYNHVVAFCQDQHGSRFIQQKLEICLDIEKQGIFDEIIPSAYMLMSDVFGNYVLQKLFEYGTPAQCESLAALLAGQCVQLSMQMYGCRVVQKALEYVDVPRLLTIISEFESPAVLLRCVYDSNGNHVIQKCIEVVSNIARKSPGMESFNDRIQFIMDTFKGKVKELSSHPYGCRVVQRILEHCCSKHKFAVLEELRECCADLVQDCYGNYVIQYVMQHGQETDRQLLIKEVQSKLLDFSQHKFASNVVEKCLQYANKRDRDEMIWTIINVTFDLNSPVDAKTGHCVLESMVRDPYANYVVQKVIDVSDEKQRNAIMRYVRENIIQLRRYTYGKHILVRLEKLTNEKFN